MLLGTAFLLSIKMVKFNKIQIFITNYELGDEFDRQIPKPNSEYFWSVDRRQKI